MIDLDKCGILTTRYVHLNHNEEGVVRRPRFNRADTESYRDNYLEDNLITFIKNDGLDASLERYGESIRHDSYSQSLTSQDTYPSQYEYFYYPTTSLFITFTGWDLNITRYDKVWAKLAYVWGVL